MGERSGCLAGQRSVSHAVRQFIEHVPYVVWFYFAEKYGQGKRNGSKTVLSMSSTYHCAVSVPLMTTKGFRFLKEMAPEPITPG
ncbi:hypothetical protein TNCV_4500801 [Trichonephila clavipes]|nr:hypothetical protein TNCV_4500801 [Trichonephila clavipes]